MASRKQEERNEKIIRGLMKLPPNRRCINCNSLGPQYVCPNFWTFVCTTCSGIHREFTHRVKSVSMSKFTSQEVEALQNGGNQRAREVYLKDWDLQRQRLPDSSKVEKIRDFIRSVYVDKKYAGGRTSEKPPRDMQSHRVLEDETRRASSYHSYSQSPPYDHQYEDRRYGKQASALTRKPGSDRGRYEGKMSSFVYSAGRLSEQMYEDRFENEGSGPRDSDYSVSSGGDASRSGVQSPNFPKDIGSSSPSFPPSWDNMTEVRCQAKNTLPESNVKRDATGIPCRQRTASSGSFGSVESYSMSLKSFNSGRFTDTVSEPEQATGTFQDKSTSLTGSSLFGSSDTLDLFKAPSKSEEVSSAALSIDLFQLPATSSSPSIDLFQPSVSSSASSMNINQPQGFSPASLELFAHFPQQQSTATLNNQVPNSVPKSEGWATFDSPQSSASIPGTENLPTAYIDSNGGGSMGKLDLFSSSNTQWQSFHYSGINGPSSDISSPWSGGLQDVTAPTSTSTQSWNAFEVSTPLEGTKKDGEPGATDNLLSAGGHFLGFRISEDSSTYGIQRASSQGETHDPGLPSNVVLGQSYTPQVLPQMGEIQSHGSEQKSNNPFDLPYDTDLDQNNMFVDMSSLQASLPNTQLQSPFLGGVSQAWFPQNPVTGIPYIPAAAESGLTYMAGQAQSSQIPNVPTQEPIASIGGNPFA